MIEQDPRALAVFFVCATLAAIIVCSLMAPS